jgi:hypothetical protein
LLNLWYATAAVQGQITAAVLRISLLSYLTLSPVPSCFSS